jgi:hypothetical protein
MKECKDSAALMLTSLSNIEIMNIQNHLIKIKQLDLADRLSEVIDIMHGVSEEIKEREIDFGDFL